MRLPLLGLNALVFAVRKQLHQGGPFATMASVDLSSGCRVIDVPERAFFGRNSRKRLHRCARAGLSSRAVLGSRWGQGALHRTWPFERASSGSACATIPVRHIPRCPAEDACRPGAGVREGQLWRSSARGQAGFSGTEKSQGSRTRKSRRNGPPQRRIRELIPAGRGLSRPR